MSKGISEYKGTDQEFWVPSNVKNKETYLQNRLRKVLEANAHSEVKKQVFEKYAKALDEAIDYVQDLGDYRLLSNEARRIVMFLLSVNKAWTTIPEVCIKKPDEVLKFINADLLPEFRKQIILDFIEEPTSKPLQDWEKEILLNNRLNITQVMYMLGRSYSDVKLNRQKEQCRQWKLEHPEEISKRRKQYYLEHKEKKENS